MSTITNKISFEARSLTQERSDSGFSPPSHFVHVTHFVEFPNDDVHSRIPFWQVCATLLIKLLGRLVCRVLVPVPPTALISCFQAGPCQSIFYKSCSTHHWPSYLIPICLSRQATVDHPSGVR